MNHNGDTVRQTQKNRQQHRNTQQQSTERWSEISTGMKNGILLKNAAQIFRATAENRASNTHSDIEHNEHSAQQALKTLLCAVFTFLEQQHSRAVLQKACRAFYSVELMLLCVD